MGEGSEGFWQEGRGELETPDRSTRNCQNETSIGKIEDSPIFSFINSLSPIKPVKSAHISQMINPLSFTSLPSIFTSPHANPLRESRFIRGPQLSDPSKPEFSSGDANKEIVDGPKKSAQQKESLKPKAPDCKMAECFWKSSSVVVFAEEASQRSLFTSEGNPEGVSQVNLKKGIMACDSGSLIPNSADVFESQNGLEFDKKPVDPATSFYSRIKDAVQNMHTSGAEFSGDQIGVESGHENLPAQLGEEIENMETIGDITNASEMMDFEQFSGLYRGIRRRCLVFEMTGGNYVKQLEENSSSDSSLLLQSDGSTSSRQQLQFSQCALPGVGLHLNPLAKTPKEYKIVNHEASASGRLLIGCSLSANFPPQTFGEELFGNSLVDSLERQIDTFENGVLPVEDPCLESAYMPDAEIIQSCQKKKRRRMEPAREGESCKRCSCKKSRCLKLYCECFAAGVYCVEPCACIDCFNKPIHKDTVLTTRKQIESRNPLAFAPKVIRGSDSTSEARDDFSKTPASARHKRGCNCKKSGCLKKYCECYQGGVGCSINCRCEGCKNTFGRKNGSGMIGVDTESEEDEMESTQKAAMDSRPSEKTKILENMEQNMDLEPPTTPSRFGSFPSSQGMWASSFFPPFPKLGKKLQTVKEDEKMPEFLQGVSSPVDSIKSSSPNRKRVSPPQQIGVSLGLGSNRKLMLKSIPSFPSLSSNQ